MMIIVVMPILRPLGTTAFFICLIIIVIASCISLKAGGILLSIFPKNTTRELVGFFSTLHCFAFNPSNVERKAVKLRMPNFLKSSA